MLVGKIGKLVEDNPDVVTAVEKEELTEEEHVSSLKVKLLLRDGTALLIREVVIRDEIVAYSYYWLRPDSTVIVGWDNAPHHQEVSSFPHHKHVGNKIEASAENELTAVIAFIRDFLV